MADKPLAARHAPERKNLDELEILRVIINANPKLKKKVLVRIEEIQEEHALSAKIGAKPRPKKGT